MKLSVILPCYNGAETIAVQLDALAQQQWSGNWEIIVVNNGSTDRSMEIVATYRDRLPNLQITDAYMPPGPRLPVAHSYNVGVQTATGDAYLFCEADDEVAVGWLAAMADALSEHEFVAGALRYNKLNPDWLVASQAHWHQEDGLVDPDGPVNFGFAYGCNLGIRASVYEALGGLDESLPTAADKDFCWRAQQAGFKLYFAPDAVVQYRLRSTPKSAFRQGKTWGKDQPLLYARYRIPLENPVVVYRVLGLLKYLPVGLKLGLMSRFNIGRGKGGFVRWIWGFGFQIGEIQGFFEHPNLDFARKTASKL